MPWKHIIKYPSIPVPGTPSICQVECSFPIAWTNNTNLFYYQYVVNAGNKAL